MHAYDHRRRRARTCIVDRSGYSAHLPPVNRYNTLCTRLYCICRDLFANYCRILDGVEEEGSSEGRADTCTTRTRIHIYAYLCACACKRQLPVEETGYVRNNINVVCTKQQVRGAQINRSFVKKKKKVPR